MSDKIIAACITAGGNVGATIIAAIITQDPKKILIVFGCSSALVIACLIILFVVKGRQKNNKVKRENITLLEKISELSTSKIALEERYSALEQEKQQLEEQLTECNTTILEVDKYLDRSHVTNSAIIKSTINEHYYLSKDPVLNFESIVCDVKLVKSAKPNLYNTNFVWRYKGHRERACTDFLVDVFSTTKLDNDFEKSLSISYYSNGSWYKLEKGKGYDITDNMDDYHRTIKFVMSKIPTEDFNISIRYTLKENYNIDFNQETFVFMPFIYSNARNNKFECKINVGNINVEKAIIINSAADEEKSYDYDDNNNRVFSFIKEYNSSNDFKNVTLNILHKKP